MNNNELSLHLLKPKFKKFEECQKLSEKKINETFLEFQLLKCNGGSFFLMILFTTVLLFKFKASILIYIVVFVVTYFIWRSFSIRRIFFRS